MTSNSNSNPNHNPNPYPDPDPRFPGVTDPLSSVIQLNNTHGHVQPVQSFHFPCGHSDCAVG